jgi:hydroxyacylglutathione hydrolase
MNAYIIRCQASGAWAIVDPGEEAGRLLAAAPGKPEMILITHGHFDHVGALEEIRRQTGAPVYMHPADADQFSLNYDQALSDGIQIRIGDLTIRAIHAPGHTPGMTCFDLGDGRIVVGDTIFVGGPGKTWSPAEFQITMETMGKVVFSWPDETRFYPGHGPSGRIGDERPAYEAFLNHGWNEDLFGDVTWA